MVLCRIYICTLLQEDNDEMAMMKQVVAVVIIVDAAIVQTPTMVVNRIQWGFLARVLSWSDWSSHCSALCCVLTLC